MIYRAISVNADTVSVSVPYWRFIGTEVIDFGLGNSNTLLPVSSPKNVSTNSYSISINPKYLVLFNVDSDDNSISVMPIKEFYNLYSDKITGDGVSKASYTNASFSIDSSYFNFNIEPAIQVMISPAIANLECSSSANAFSINKTFDSSVLEIVTANVDQEATYTSISQDLIYEELSNIDAGYINFEVKYDLPQESYIPISLPEVIYGDKRFDTSSDAVALCSYSESPLSYSTIPSIPDGIENVAVIQGYSKEAVSELIIYMGINKLALIPYDINPSFLNSNVPDVGDSLSIEGVDKGLNPPLKIDSSTIATVTTGRSSFYQELFVTNYAPNQVFQIQSGLTFDNLPVSFEYDSTTGKLTMKYYEEGISDIILTATDSDGNKFTYKITFMEHLQIGGIKCG